MWTIAAWKADVLVDESMYLEWRASRGESRVYHAGPWKLVWELTLSDIRVCFSIRWTVLLVDSQKLIIYQQIDGTYLPTVVTRLRQAWKLSCSPDQNICFHIFLWTEIKLLRLPYVLLWQKGPGYQDPPLFIYSSPLWSSQTAMTL